MGTVWAESPHRGREKRETGAGTESEFRGSVFSVGAHPSAAAQRAGYDQGFGSVSKVGAQQRREPAGQGVARQRAAGREAQWGSGASSG